MSGLSLPLPLLFLAAARSLVGGAILFHPPLSTIIFDIPITPGSIYPRLFGARDLVFGGLLWSARSPELVRQAVIAGAIVDGIDTLSAAAGLMEGNLDAASAAFVGIGAPIFLAIGLWGLGGLR